jgi:hypothetical protein
MLDHASFDKLILAGELAHGQCLFVIDNGILGRCGVRGKLRQVSVGEPLTAVQVTSLCKDMWPRDFLLPRYAHRLSIVEDDISVLVLWLVTEVALSLASATGPVHLRIRFL